MILELLGIAAFSIIWADRFKPFEDFKHWIGLGKNSEFKSRHKFSNYCYAIIKKLFNCICISAWIALFIYGDIFIASLAYILAEIMYASIEYIKNNTNYQ
jgi:hypothetical protein